MNERTTFEQPALERYLTMFRIGDLVSCVPVPEGRDNSTYLVTTSEHGEESEYMLSIMERYSFADVPFFSSVLRHLFHYGLPVAAPKQTLDGMTSTIFCGKPTLLFPRLAGDHPSGSEPQHCKLVGKILGELHVTLSAVDSFERENPYSSQWMTEQLESLDLNDQQRSLLGRLISDYEVAQELDLPRGVIHGDLQPDNVLFDGDEITGVLDFYQSCQDFLIHDLAVCINNWCSSDTGVDPDLRLSLIDAYREQRDLTDEELEFLPLFQKFSALRSLLAKSLTGETDQQLIALLQYYGESK